MGVPVQLTSFIGRSAELAEITGIQRSCRLLTLVGAGGCGKTRLALEAAGKAMAAYDATFWVELAPITAAGDIPGAIARALGLREDALADTIGGVTARIGASPTLMILDNCEHLLPATADIARLLLERCPNLVVICTSREPLRVPGEVAWRVPSMSTPSGAGVASLEEISAAEAVQLFVERAKGVSPGFRLTSVNGDAVSQVCRRLDGIPLAIELAAARTGMLSPGQIAAGLDDAFHVVAGGSLALPRRHQTLRASIEWSHDLLDEPQRAALRRLAVFAGGFTIEAAEAVAGFGDVQPEDVLDLVAGLVDRSLVTVEMDPLAARYGMLETIRQFSHERLLESAEADESRDRHMRWFVDLSEGIEAELAGRDHRRAMNSHVAESDNYRSALECALEHADPEPALRLVIGLEALWLGAGQSREGVKWYERALATTGGDPGLRRMATFAWLDVLTGMVGALGAAPRMVELREAAREAGDEAVLARLLSVWARWLIWSDPVKCRSMCLESIELARKNGDIWCEARALEQIVLTWILQGQAIEALALMPELRDVLSRGDDATLDFGATNMPAFAQLLLGDLTSAGPVLEEQASRAHDLGQPIHAGWFASYYFGVYLPLVGRFDEARAGLEEWLDELRAAGAGSALVMVHLRRAEVALAEGDLESVIRHAASRVDASRAQGAIFTLSVAQCAVGEARLAQGDTAAARAALEEGLDAARRYGNRVAEANALAGLASFQVACGDYQAAEALAHDALHLRVAGKLRAALPDSLDQLGTILIHLESLAQGTRLIAAAGAARTAMATVRRPCDEPGCTRALDLARSGMGADFEAVWTEGGRLTADDAVAYARRARGDRKRPTSGWASLTPVEEQVVMLVAEGFTNPQVAERLFIAPGTVKTHLSHVFNKLGVSSRTELASAAVKRGMHRADSIS